MSDAVQCVGYGANKATDDSSARPTSSSPADVSELNKMIAQAKGSILKKEEQLRKLHMVVTYREKNNQAPLDSLITQWRTAVQEALADLRQKLPEPAPTYSEILDRLQIKHSTVGYNREEDSFS